MSVKPTHHYLDFTRKDRRGTIFLLSIICLLCSAPFLYPVFTRGKTRAMSIDSSLVALSVQQSEARDKKYTRRYEEDDRRPYDHPYEHAPQSKGTLFYFDPNTISAEGWKKLGLRDKTIATILNFRNKGGKFREPADIKRIWGLFPDEAERLMPYITIEAKEEGLPGKNHAMDFPKKYEHKKAYASVDINSGDTSAWVALPGIGTKLSQRITSFRDKLGGFYSVDQVGETFGLHDSVFQKIKPLLNISGEVKKININTATIEELKAHPYIRYKLANAIVQYRTQHGSYKSVSDIKKIMIVDEAVYNKLIPYLSVE